MSQVIDAHREHFDKLTEINKSQALEIITLREQRDRVIAAAKYYLEHPMDAEGVNIKAAARLWNIIREVEGEQPR